MPAVTVGIPVYNEASDIATSLDCDERYAPGALAHAHDTARKVFDCFLFYNELDILEIRLSEMDECVDHFVLVEARTTFQGAPKPLYYRENQARFAQWADKIIHVVVDDPPIPRKWAAKAWWYREHHQRDQMARGLASAGPYDLVIVSDVDEIIRRPVLRDLIDNHRKGRIYLLQLGLYHFCLNQRDRGVAWEGHRILERRFFRSGQQTRRIKSQASKRWAAIGLGALGVRRRNWMQAGVFRRAIEVPDAGWHFSSIGDYENWRRKIDAYSHPEVKQWAAYQSVEAFDAWVAGLEIEPIANMPQMVREDRRFQCLLAARDADASPTDALQEELKQP